MTTDKRIGFSLAAIAVLVGLTLAVINGTKSPDCEALYNEMTNTANVQLQQAIMSHGYEVGCFHAE